MKKSKEQDHKNPVEKQTFPKIKNKTPFSDKIQEHIEEHNCNECNDDKCKCNQIIHNLSNIIDLTEQIGHAKLHNVILTIFIILQNLSDHEDDLLKILNTCQEVYKNLNPKEMGLTLN